MVRKDILKRWTAFLFCFYCSPPESDLEIIIFFVFIFIYSDLCEGVQTSFCLRLFDLRLNCDELSFENQCWRYVRFDFLRISEG